MNWLISHLLKEARGRRFSPKDNVRYFVEQRKGKGKGIILTPSFNRGTVVDFDGDSRRYKIRNNKDEIIDVHPRNLIPDSVSSNPASSTIMPEMSTSVSTEEPIGPLV